MSSNYSGPRMGMNQMNGNNRRSANLTRLPSNEKHVHHDQHEEVIKYMQDSWNKVVVAPETNRSHPMPVYYTENPKPIPKEIDSIDMEDVWDMRVMGEQNQNLTTQPQQQQQHHHS